MVNRVSTTTIYSQLLADMQTNAYNYYKLTAQLSSGTRLTNITDDPVAAVNVLNTNRQLTQISTFQTNVSLASTELDALDDLLDLATSYLSTAYNKAVEASNQTYGDSSLQAIKDEIDELIKTMVDLANTQYNGNYIFSGANTQTAAYVIDDDGNIIYQGTPQDNPDYIRQTEIADGVFEVINTTGDKVFGYYICSQEQTDDGSNVYLDSNGNRIIETIDSSGNTVYTYEDSGDEYTGDTSSLTASMTEEYSGVMGAMKLLSNSLQMILDGNYDEGYELMGSTLDMFNESLTTITTEQTKFGAVANRLEMASSTLETTSDSLTSYLSEINDIDYAEAVTNWLNAQYAYQASLQISSSILGMSLLNYL